MIDCLVAARHAFALVLAGLALSFLAPAARADCPANALEVFGICYPCDWPKVPNDTKTACIACAQPKVPNANQTACILSCNQGTTPNSTETACVPPPKCGPAHHVSSTSCPSGQPYCCQACGPGEGWYQQGAIGYGQCQLCTVGQIPNPTQDDFNLPACIPCTGGTIATVEGCLPCTGNKIADSDHSHCKGCFNGYVPNATHTDCVCPAGTISTASPFNPSYPSACVKCPQNTVPLVTAEGSSCVACPAGTTAQLGSCVKLQASPKPVLPGTPKKPSPPRGVTGPGLLESTPGLGTQGPGAVGTPLGGPRGGGR